MLKLKVTIEGRTDSDLELALEAVTDSIQRGNTSGFDSNESGSYTFDIVGTDEDDAEEESCNVCGKPDSECRCEFCPNCDYILESCICDDEETD